MKPVRPRGATGVARLSVVQPFPPMAFIFLGIFLLVFGLNLLLGLALPGWVLGVLAVITGVLFLLEKFGLVVRRKPE